MALKGFLKYNIYGERMYIFTHVYQNWQQTCESVRVQKKTKKKQMKKNKTYFAPFLRNVGKFALLPSQATPLTTKVEHTGTDTGLAAGLL